MSEDEGKPPPSSMEARHWTFTELWRCLEAAVAATSWDAAQTWPYRNELRRRANQHWIGPDKPEARPPHTPDLPGRWGYPFISQDLCGRLPTCGNCFHWIPEPRYKDKCPNCGAQWYEHEWVK